MKNSVAMIFVAFFEIKRSKNRLEISGMKRYTSDIEKVGVLNSDEALCL
ncbi:MAG: hypothetical protein PF904_18795 [Kiritimatiellae bacterium]|jgi:hypothetical protein|nr:hypothetical protein [Kiritimatiellia bacterium]